MKDDKLLNVHGIKMLSTIFFFALITLTFSGTLTFPDAALLDGDHMQDASGANASLTNQVVRKGWGFTQGNGKFAIEDTPINYGITFNELPFLIVKFANSRQVAEGNPVNLSECSTTRNVIATGINQTTSGFKPILRTPTGLGFPSATNYCYTWIAIGSHDSSYDGEADPVFAAWDKSSGINITESQISDLSHTDDSDIAAMGYIKSYTEIDPVYSISPAQGITSTNISNWNTAYGWGDHSVQGYLKSFEESDPQVGANVSGYIPRWDGSALVSGSIYDNGSAYVGIGTDIPGYPLHVLGDIYSSDFVRGDTGLCVGEDCITSWENIDGDWTVLGSDMYSAVPGNTGIGTATPSGKLHIAGSNNALHLEGEGSFGSGARIIFGDSDYVYLSEDADDSLLLHGSSRTAIMGGNVGVGTTIPTAKLEIAGQIKITGGNPGQGKILTSDSYGLATWVMPDVPSCPGGFVQVNDIYCIEAYDRTASDWYDASNTCGDNEAKLCSWSEWYYACQESIPGLYSMTNDWEWIDEPVITATGYNNAKVAGNTNCMSTMSNDPQSGLYKFRCCYYK